MDRAAWLEERRSAITASDVAAVLGLDDHKSALHVYASKIGVEDESERLEMVRGRIYEDALARDYAHQTGRRVDYDGAGELNLRKHAKYPWIGATNDRLTITEDGEQIPLELKLAIGSGWAWKEEPPKKFQVQCLVQAAVFDSTRTALAGLVGPGPMNTSDIQYDDELFELIVPRLREFLDRVERRDPPEPTSGLALEPLKRIWPGADGRTVQWPAQRLLLGHEFRPNVEFPYLGCSWGLTEEPYCCCHRESEHYEPNDPQRRADAWERNRAESKRLADQADDDQAVLRHALGGAQFGRLPDGSFIERKKSKAQDRLVRFWPSRRRA